DIAARLERNLTKCLEDDGESDGGAAAPAAKANAKSNKKAPQKQFRYETKAARAAANDKIKSAKLARNKAWAEKRKAAGQGKSGKPGKQGKSRK
ncbi:hypothetical protein IWQ56_001384, partial [Coemansia nantahalensis]